MEFLSKTKSKKALGVLEGSKVPEQSNFPTLIDEAGREAHTGCEKANMLNSFFQML